MEIEVGQTSGAFLKARVKKVSKKGIEVDYLNDWGPSELVSFDRCRVPCVKKAGVPLAAARSIVEVYVQQPESEVYAWQKAKVRHIRGSFAVVDCIEGPPNKDVVFVELCRAADRTTPLSYKLHQSCEIKVPAELVDLFAEPEKVALTCKPLLDIVENIEVKFDKHKSRLVISSFSSGAIRLVDFVSGAFLNSVKQKKMLIDQLEHGMFVEEFAVPDELVGLAIGKGGVNIAKARDVPGVLTIEVDKLRQERTGACGFKVIAKTANAAAQARRMLEFIFAALPVSKAIVGQLVGKGGKNMQDIVNQSGAVKVQVGNGDEQLENESGEVDLVFSGTRDSFQLAKVMVQLRVRHIIEMDYLRTKLNTVVEKAASSANNVVFNNERHFPQLGAGSKK